MWLVHLGTLASAWFILAANSWMQNPVGYTYNPDTGRAELADFWAVMFNKVQLVTFPHVVLSAYMTAGAFVLGVAAYLFMKEKHAADRPLYRRAIRFGAVVTLVAGLGVAITGDIQGKIMTEVQPMKMAAAEGLYETDGATRRSRSSPSARSTARRPARDHRGAGPAVASSAPATFGGDGRGHQPAPREVHRGVRPGPGRRLLHAPATTPPSSR